MRAILKHVSQLENFSETSKSAVIGPGWSRTRWVGGWDCQVGGGGWQGGGGSGWGEVTFQSVDRRTHECYWFLSHQRHLDGRLCDHK